MEANYFIEQNESGIFCGEDKLARIDSRTVAEAFGESHDNVMKAIENLDCSAYFRSVNFDYGDNGKSCPCYTMTREGFTLLVSSYIMVSCYIREKYVQIRKEFFKRFDEMESIVNEKFSEESA